MPHIAGGPTELLPTCTAPTPPKISSFTPKTASPCVFVQTGASTTAPEPQVGPQAVPGGVNSVIRGMATDRGGIRWPLILSSFILARLSRQLPRSFSCEACSKSSRRQHQTEDAGRGPKQGGWSGSPSQKARLTGHFSLQPTKTWIVPATPSQAACSTAPSQPRQSCCGSRPVPVPLLPCSPCPWGRGSSCHHPSTPRDTGRDLSAGEGRDTHRLFWFTTWQLTGSKTASLGKNPSWERLGQQTLLHAQPRQ